MNEFLGPPLAGALVAVGMALALGIGSGTYLVAAGALLVLRGSFRSKQSSSASLWSEIPVGLRYLWEHKLLRTISLMVAVMAAGWSAWTAVLVVYVVRPGPVGLSSFGYGVLLATLALGGLVGTATAGWVVRRVGRRGVMAIDVAATIMMLAVPGVTANEWVIGVATFIGGLGSGMWNVVVVSLRQALTPDAYMGRVAAASRLVGWGTMPLGAAVAGVVAEFVSIRAVFVGAAVLTAGLVIPMLRSQPVRSLKDARFFQGA
jgi:MFS family permease